MTVKYCVGRLNATCWPDAAACLAEHGIHGPNARPFIEKAQVLYEKWVRREPIDREIAFVPLTHDKALVMRIAAHGHYEAWWAITDELFDTREEAKEFADELEAAMLQQRWPTWQMGGI
jgi:L-rhamnose mutarotase